MKFLEAIVADTLSEFEMLEFLKSEVKRLNKDNVRLLKKVQLAYTYGYEDHYRGLKFDHDFKIDDLE